ncbi:hypothetical protein KFL_000340270 [Klebsormidium nitens]|uniref:MYND-type domain-containing protein n=1 Tax=Klebsormidium nitens TaxID=105231 RepID=A0A1Y1HLY1_KLENI|nr:hypothetical protein KFL_000340270 [Klebsormidium nitens]|eukprot:GAQ79624.1 hypothetical protein KFL_000340270 [Klebsormidium nitens]
MAEESKSTLSTFLDMLREGRSLDAAQQFGELVGLVCPSGMRMTEQQEQALQLKPTPPYKKLRKLTESRDVVEGLLSILSHDGEAAYLLLDSICLLSSAPGFATRIGDCGLAAALLACGGWLFPRTSSSLQSPDPRRAPPLSPLDEKLLRAAGAFVKSVTLCVDRSKQFYEEALELGLLDAIMAFFPWGDPPRGRRNAERNTFVLLLAKHVAKAFRGFVDEPGKEQRLIGCNAELTAWLVRYVHFLTRTAEALVPKPVYEQEHSDIGTAAQNVVEMFNRGRNCQLLLDYTQLEELERAVNALLPHLEMGAKFQVEGFLSTVHGLRWDVPLETEVAISGFVDLNEELQSLVSLVSQDRRAFSARFDAFYKGYRVLSTESCPRGLISKELLDVLTTGSVERVKAPGRLSEESIAVLRSLKNALRVALDAGFEPEAFDDVALPLVRHVEPALTKLGGMAFQHLLGGLIECYKGGGERTRPAKLWAPLLISVLELDIDQTALRFAWHFLAVLVGASQGFDIALLKAKGVDDGPDEPPGECTGRPLAPPEERRALATDIGSKLRARIFAPAWRVYSHHADFGISDGDRVEDVSGVLLWCCADSGLVERKLLPKAGLLVRILALDYGRLSERCNRDATSAFVRDPWPDKCRPLAAMLRLGFEITFDNRHARKALVEDVSRSGGVELCRAVERDARKPGVLRAGAVNEPDLAWVPSFQALCEELWAAIALRFGLKECSNPDCTQNLYETKKKDFQKCSKCLRVQYCSKDCQTSHWKAKHRHECQRVSDASLCGVT